MTEEKAIKEAHTKVELQIIPCASKQCENWNKLK